MFSRSMRYFVTICIGLLLVATFSLYRGAYFSTDDFHCLYWVQQQSPMAMASHVLNPISGFFRPTGMLVYWILLRVFGLHATVYHVVAWMIHAANTMLVYMALRRLVGSSAGAVVGAVLFASQGAFSDVYWNFGAIFELVSQFGMLLALFLWMAPERSWKRAALCSLIFLFSMKGKEMAVTLPALWLAGDLLLRRPFRWRYLTHYAPAAVFALVWGIVKVTVMRHSGTADLYFMDVRPITLGRGFAVLLNLLFETHFRWQFWAIGFVLALIVFTALRRWKAVFFLSYIFIAFLPVVFLNNHREPYMWYIPFLGISGLAAMLTAAVWDGVRSRWGNPAAAGLAYVSLPLLCVVVFVVQLNESAVRRSWQKPMDADYRAFFKGMQSIDKPPAGEILYFDSQPLYFNQELLRNATQVALRRTDIEVRLVEEFPDEASYRVGYREQRVVRLH